jgi:NADH-quinone oxidoreductase subunit G
MSLLDRERCFLCQRCTRFSDQISGDTLINLVERGAKSQIGMDPALEYDSYFSGNVIQICPVGALTSADYRFQARPFDLVSTTTTCDNCAAGCELRVDHRHYQVKRRLAGENAAINEDWNCDKGRFGFRSGHLEDRLTAPLVRRNGVLEQASWPEALSAAAKGLSGAGDSAVLTNGRLTLENALAYSRFARVVLGTNNVDFRIRDHSVEETAFLTTQIAGPQPVGIDYAALENAKRVILVAVEPEDESPMVFLRLRKAVRKKGLQVTAIAPLASRGTNKLGAELLATAPGGEIEALSSIAASLDADTVILVGERAVSTPGLLHAVVQVAQTSGARFAWIPRRAGELAAIKAGLLPNLLPGGHAVADSDAVAAGWLTTALPTEPGLDAGGILSAAANGEIAKLVIGGVELADFPDPALAAAAIDKAGFVVVLEQRLSAAAQQADVVLPVALLEEQEGTFVSWTGEARPVGLVNRQAVSPMPDIRALAALAEAMDADLGMRTAGQARANLEAIGEAATVPSADGLVGTQLPDVPEANDSGLVLATWRELLDDSRSIDGADALKATARPAVARISLASAQSLGLTEGQQVTVSLIGADPLWTGPVEVSIQMADGVVWLPRNPLGSPALTVRPGTPVAINATALEEA